MPQDDPPCLFSDAIFEILTRTSSLRTLDACKCVSNEWKDLISGSNFMPSYCERTNNLCGYFFQVFRKTKHLSMFVDLSEEKRGDGMELPEYMRIVASCNQGLLCCLREETRKYRFYVCKPATRQWRALPNPKLRYRGISVAIMALGSSPRLHYKIVRLSKDHDPRVSVEFNSIRCEIFDSNTWKWRETERLHLSGFEFIVQSNSAVRIGESFYWLTSDDNVVAFNVADESFEKFPLPQIWAYTEFGISKRLVNYRGRLGFTYKRDSVMELWLSDHSTMNWTMEKGASISGLKSPVEFLQPAGFYDAEIACIRTYAEAIFYNLQDCSVLKEVNLGDKVQHADEYFEFRSDFEPVDLTGGWCGRRLSSEPKTDYFHICLWVFFCILISITVTKFC